MWQNILKIFQKIPASLSKHQQIIVDLTIAWQTFNVHDSCGWNFVSSDRQSSNYCAIAVLNIWEKPPEGSIP